MRAPSSNIISFGTNMPAGVLGFVRKQPHVAVATGVLTQGTGFLTSITGIDLTEFNRLSGGFRFVRGGPFRAANDAIIDEYYADEHKLHMGDTFQVLNQPWHVVGVIEPGMLARLFVQLNILQELTSNPSKVTMIYVKLDDPARTDQVVADQKTS